MKKPQPPWARLDQAIRQCRKKKTLNSFLGCINLAHDLSLGYAILADLLDSLKDDLIPEGSFESSLKLFLDWVQGWNFHDYHATEKCMQLIADVVTGFASPDFLEEARLRDENKVAQLALRSSEVTDTSVTEHVDFTPYLEVEEYISGCFDKDRHPGKVISYYVNHIFPDEPECDRRRREKRICTNQSLRGIFAKLIRHMAHNVDGDLEEQEKAKQLVESAGLVALASLLEQTEAQPIAEEWLTKVMYLMPMWPCALIEAVLKLLKPHAHEDVEERFCLKLMEILAQCSEGIEAPPWEEMFLTAFMILGDTDSPNYSNEDVHGINESAEKMINSWIRKDRLACTGVSSVSREVLANLITSYGTSFALTGGDWDHIANRFGKNLWVSIASWNHYHDHSLGVYLYIKDNPSSRKNGIVNISEYFDSTRPEYFLNAYDAAMDAGLVELANALVAFGVASHVIFGRSIHGWSKKRLSEIILQPDSYPGMDMVKRAIKFAASMDIVDSKYLIHKKWLTSYLSEQVTETKIPVHFWLKRDQIEERWKDILGSSCWLWLFPETKKLLVDADVTYSRCHIDLGTEITNFGRFTLDYCLSLEKELILRFDSLFKSLEFSEYKTHNKLSGKETFGTIIYLIRNHNALPKALQEKIYDENLAIHQDDQLVRWLSFLHQARNNAAHASSNKDSNLIEVRNLIKPVFNTLMKHING